MGIITIGFLTSSPQDFIRLLIIPVFIWLGWKDYQNRIVENKYWPPLLIAGALLFIWDVIVAANTGALDLFVFTSVVNFGVILPSIYFAWRIGGIGGADVKAIAAITVCIPVIPTYYTKTIAYPIETGTSVFILALLTNMSIILMLSFVWYGIYNAYNGNISKYMFFTIKTPVKNIFNGYGKLCFQTDDETDDKMTGRIQVNVIEEYLEWRECTIEDIRTDPCRYREPETVPELNEEQNNKQTDNENSDTDLKEDWWGASVFLNNHFDPHMGQSVNSESLVDALEELTIAEKCWIAPGIPLITYIAAAIPITLVTGNIMLYLL
mgnify:CR=1 FL=1